MHTPGPWTTSPTGRYVRYCGTHGANICDMDPFEGNPEEREANARLIAAAPELLEALKELHDLICGECPGLLEGDYRDDMARAAIAKATGGAE